MKTTLFLLLTAFLLTATICASVMAETIRAANNSQTIQPTPEALLKDLYKVHNQKNSRILRSRTLIDKYFDKNLANLIWKDLTTHKNSYGVIDFDIFYNTQDPLIKNLSIGQAKLTGAKAAVSVSFTNDGRKEVIVYLLSKQNGSWKISDIKYENGETLLKYFKEGV